MLIASVRRGGDGAKAGAEFSTTTRLLKRAGMLTFPQLVRMEGLLNLTDVHVPGAGEACEVGEASEAGGAAHASESGDGREA